MPTFPTMFELFINRKGSFTEDTIKTYRATVGRFCDWAHDQGLTLETLKERHVINYMAKAGNGGNGRAWSINTERAHKRGLKTFFGFAQKIAKQEGCEIIMEPKMMRDLMPAKPDLEYEYLDQEQAQTLRNITGSLRDRCIFNVMLDTGLRRSEVASLNVKDFKEEKDGTGTISVKGKGGKRAYVYLMPKTCKILNMLIKHQPNRPDDPIFWSTHRGKTYRMTGPGITRMFERYSETLGFRVRPHMLRHTYCRQLFEAGIPANSVQKLMRHSDPSITLSIYAKLYPHDVRDTYFEKFSRFLNNGHQSED
jgi:site-specific recombinase XerD